MTTRRKIISGCLSSFLVPFVGKCSPVKSMLGSIGIKEISSEESIDYTTGYTNLIEEWAPTGTGNQIIQLSYSLVPLSDFTIDGCITYTGDETGNSTVIGLNENSSLTFSLWYRNGNIVPRCFATESTSNPIAVSVIENPTFCFSIRFDLEAQTMTFSNGDLSKNIKFSTTNWTWNTAYGRISSGLTSFGMDYSRLSNINSIRVYPFILTDEELMYNNSIDKERFQT